MDDQVKCEGCGGTWNSDSPMIYPWGSYVPPLWMCRKCHAFEELKQLVEELRDEIKKMRTMFVGGFDCDC